MKNIIVLNSDAGRRIPHHRIGKANDRTNQGSALRRVGKPLFEQGGGGEAGDGPHAEAHPGRHGNEDGWQRGGNVSIVHRFRQVVRLFVCFYKWVLVKFF